MARTPGAAFFNRPIRIFLILGGAPGAGSGFYDSTAFFRFETRSNDRLDKAIKKRGCVLKAADCRI